MRNQYYADSRDVFKWSAILRWVRAHRLRSVLQVVMLRPDDDSNEGGTVHLPGFHEEAVARFFEEERRKFSRRPSLRDVRRIASLPNECGGGFEIRVFDRPFSGSGYFEEAAELARALPSPAMTFLDPDTGMGKGNGPQRHKQVRVEEIRSLYSSLRDGDMLTLFQYSWRQKNWVEHLEAMFRDAVGNAPVEYVREAELALFAVCKGKQPLPGR